MAVSPVTLKARRSCPPRALLSMPQAGALAGPDTRRPHPCERPLTIGPREGAVIGVLYVHSGEEALEAHGAEQVVAVVKDLTGQETTSM